MINILASFVIYHGVEHLWGLTKDYKIGIYRFSAKHAALSSKNKNWLAKDSG